LETTVLPLNYIPSKNLLFGFFMDGAFPAPLAIFFQFYFPFHFFLVFPRPVINSFASPTLQLY
jgi:hypothetical protein